MSASSIRVAVVGVGNCASSLVQGLGFYSGQQPNAQIGGLMTDDIGGYRPHHIGISAAFDVHAGKVGRDIAEAIQLPPNNTYLFADMAAMGVTVRRGPTLDGIGPTLGGHIQESDEPPVDVADVLASSRTDVVVSYLPVGSQKASEYYAEQALNAGCAYVNCIPVFLASDPKWSERFRKRGLPIVGDDVKSQLGATIIHRTLVNLFRERGVQVHRTYQLNFGGNTDFLNMLDRDRLESKKVSKTQSVNSQFDEPLTSENIHIGPSDYVPWLEDKKVAHIRVEGSGFGGAPVNVELKLEVWDSPNSAGVVTDAIRCAKLALDRGEAGALVGPSSYLMKSPPRQFTDAEARHRMLAFIRGEELDDLNGLSGAFRT